MQQHAAVVLEGGWLYLRQAHLEKVPGSKCTCMQQHAKAVLRRKLALPIASHHRHDDMCQVAAETACISIPQLWCEEVWPCLKQASVGTMTCARLRVQPHAIQHARALALREAKA